MDNNGGPAALSGRQALVLNELLQTSLFLRRALATRLFDKRRDIDGECGYLPTGEISSQLYRAMYDREGVAKRANDILPEECWAMDPYIYETEDTGDETEFERAWRELDERLALLFHMQRVDILSGIGHYGGLFYGLDDGEDPAQPVPGVTGDGEFTEEAKGRKLLYLRAFDESQMWVASYNRDIASPRYCLPETYHIRVSDPTNEQQSGGAGLEMRNMTVHWTRVEHIADNRMSSEVFGVPRLRPIWNRLCDLRKIQGGSAEMFWKGGFPGFSFETTPDVGEIDIDKKSLEEEFNKYQQGLQRFMAFNGLTVKSLAPQVADPEHHYDIQIKAIALTIGAPLSIFLGDQETIAGGKENSQIWNKRLSRRQNRYLAPHIIRPVAKRLIAFGILPKPNKLYVGWPDLNTSTDEEKAKTAAQRTNALATYVGGGVEAMVPPEEFMIYVLGMPQEVVDNITAAAATHEATLETPEERAAKLGPANTPKPATRPAPANAKPGARRPSNIKSGDKRRPSAKKTKPKP